MSVIMLAPTTRWKLTNILCNCCLSVGERILTIYQYLAKLEAIKIEWHFFSGHNVECLGYHKAL